MRKWLRSKSAATIFHSEWNYTIAPMLTGPDDANRPVAGFEVEG